MSKEEEEDGPEFLKSIDMLSEPLTDPEGNINPLCIAELSEAIEAIPPDSIRLANNPEWTRKAGTTVTDILTEFAKETIRIFNGQIPPQFDGVFGYLRACLVADTRFELHDEALDFRYGTLSLCEISETLHEILLTQETFERWNSIEGLKALDPGCAFDWVDLHALLRNVCIVLRDGRRMDHAFDRSFKREYPESAD